jgi:hypothetical protein
MLQLLRAVGARFSPIPWCLSGSRFFLASLRLESDLVAQNACAGAATRDPAFHLKLGAIFATISAPVAQLDRAVAF